MSERRESDGTADRPGPVEAGGSSGPSSAGSARGGLTPAVVQAPDGCVLMLGYMDEVALRRTLEEGRVTFYSRSRGRLWTKGETSGHWLETLSVRSDCDGDALLVTARPHGPTCHTGTASCFEAGETLLDAPARGGGEPSAGGGGEPSAESPGLPGSDRRGPWEPEPEGPDLGAALDAVWEAVVRRDRERPESSHTARLLAAGALRAAQKLGEEAVETALAAAARPERVASESADLLYHLLVLWRATGLEPRAVAEELAARRAAGEEREEAGRSRGAGEARGPDKKDAGGG